MVQVLAEAFKDSVFRPDSADVHAVASDDSRIGETHKLLIVHADRIEAVKD
jgi:hypothetical protein